MAGKVEFPDDMPDDLCAFIAALLTLDPSKRLGAGPHGGSNVRAHHFFDVRSLLVACGGGGGGVCVCACVVVVVVVVCVCVRVYGWRKNVRSSFCGVSWTASLPPPRHVPPIAHSLVH